MSFQPCCLATAIGSLPHKDPQQAVQVVLRAIPNAPIMGSRFKYAEYFGANPGVYFRSVGWVERAAELHGQLVSGGLCEDRDALIAKYGEERGQFLYEEATRYHRSYHKLTYIRTGSELDDQSAGQAQQEAAGKGWEYEEVSGSLNLFRRLLAGDWQSDFVIVPPGHRLTGTHDDEILKSEPSP